LAVTYSLYKFKGTVSEDTDLVHLYNTWKAENNKLYASSIEHDYRFKVFSDNYKYITEMNQVSHHTFKLGLNLFSDLTSEEFLAKYTGLAPEADESNEHKSNEQKDLDISGSKLTADSIDWVNSGYLQTPIKNQGGCGSCWAFATIATLEMLYTKTYGKAERFSEQHLVDCDHVSQISQVGNYGCKGGWPSRALTYTGWYGTQLEDHYPYDGVQKGCRYNSAYQIFKNKSHVSLTWLSESELKTAVNEHVVSVTIFAGPMQHYQHGIYNGACDGGNNHAVNIVGYGTDGGMPYWRLRNSWDTWWGEQGYFRLARNVATRRGQCGVHAKCDYPTF